MRPAVAQRHLYQLINSLTRIYFFISVCFYQRLLLEHEMSRVRAEVSGTDHWGGLVKCTGEDPWSEREGLLSN